MKEPKDKRTKAWKQWNENQSEGVGDSVEKFAEFTGIKKAVELFTGGKDCGCDKRRETLNKLFPYNKPKCLTEDQYNSWTDFCNRDNKNTIEPKDQQLIIYIMREVLHTSITTCANCSGSVWNKYIDKINKIYETYEL